MVKNFLRFLSVFCLCMLQISVASAAGGADISSISAQISTELGSLLALMSTIAYVTGFAFAVIGILKLKSHKDNPQQTQLSQPLMMLAVAAALVSFPYVLGAIGTTLFGSGATSVTPTQLPSGL